MKKYFIQLFVLIICITAFQVKAQDLKGKVSDKSTQQPIAEILIKTMAIKDTNLVRTAITNAQGLYNIENPLFTSIQYPTHKPYQIKLWLNGNNLEAQITSSKPLTKGTVTNIKGQVLGQNNFSQSGNLYTTTIPLNELGSQIIVFNDGYHPGHKMSTFNQNQEQQINLEQVVDNNNQIRMKSAKVDGNKVRIQLDDKPEIDAYQPLDTIVNIEEGITNEFDFEMSPWQKYKANLLFNLSKENGEKVDNATIKINPVGNDNSIETQTDSDGYGEITDIEIPHYQNNKAIPDTIDIALEISGDDIKTKIDTIRNITNGEFAFKYNNLEEKAQELGTATFWRGARDPLFQSGLSATYVFINEEFGVRDTLHDIRVPVKHDVPVNKEGETIYTYVIKPKTKEGNIPMYDKTVQVKLKDGQLYKGFDLLENLRQEFKIKGNIFRQDKYDKESDTYDLAKGVRVQVYENAPVIDPKGLKVADFISEDGTYEIGKFNAGKELFLYFSVPQDHPENLDEKVFGVFGQPIINDIDIYRVNMGAQHSKDKLTNMSDSVMQNNILLHKTFNMEGQIDAEELWYMDGNSTYNYTHLKLGKQRVFLYNEDKLGWFNKCVDYINNDMQIPFEVVRADEKVKHESMELNSFTDSEAQEKFDRTGWNVDFTNNETSSTNYGGSGIHENIGFLYGADIIQSFPTPSGEQKPRMVMKREWFTRAGAMNYLPASQRPSYSNPAMPFEMTEKEEKADDRLTNLIYYFRKSRVNEDPNKRTHNGSATIRPNIDFDKNVSQSDYYNTHYEVNYTK